MYTSKTRVHELKAVEIMIIRGRSGHFSDLFLSKQKTTNQSVHLSTYEAKWKILLKNFFLRVSNFFDPLNIFAKKKCHKIRPFSRLKRQPYFASDLAEKNRIPK